MIAFLSLIVLSLAVSDTDMELLCKYQFNWGNCSQYKYSLKVVSLYLFNLTGTFPTELLRFNTSLHLRIYSSNITGTIPTQICSMNNLNTLTLTSTSLTGTIPECIYSMVSLTSLDLSKNNLHGILNITKPFAKPFRLIIDSAKLSGTLPNIDLNLWHFSANYNLFSGTMPEKLFKSPTLNNIYLTYNILSGTLPNVTHSSFMFQYNNFTGDLPLFINNKNNNQGDVSYNSYSYSPSYPTHFNTNSVYIMVGNRISIKDVSKYNRYHSSGVTNINFGVQDEDECMIGNYNCPNNAYCSNGWLPKMSYTCSCKAGFYKLNDDNCVDINECLGQNVCLPGACINTIGSYECCPENSFVNISGECERCVVISSNYQTDDSKTNTSYPKTNSYLTCFGQCNSGYQAITKVESSIHCKIGFEVKPCVYPCADIIKNNIDNSNTITLLYVELGKGIYLEELVGFYNMSIESNDDSNWIEITLYNSYNTTLIKDIVNVIVPNITFIYNQYGDSMSIGLVKHKQISLVWAISIPVVFILVLVLFVIYYYYRSRPYYNLPSELVDIISTPITMFSWMYHGNNEAFYYYKNYKNVDNKVAQIDCFDVLEVTRVYNPTLVANFCGAYDIQRSRMINSGKIFYKKTWKGEDKDKVMCKYSILSNKYSWNKEYQPEVTVMFHGTNYMVAEKICETGFASLSSLDQGWYGKGIYFTSTVEYCRNYIISHKQPAIIISLVLPGNLYPVTEHPQQEGSLIGSALKSGFNSHYVCTNKQGVPDINGEYDEMVVSQESQILPMYIVKVKV